MKPDVKKANVPAFVPLVSDPEAFAPSDGYFGLQRPQRRVIGKSRTKYTHVQQPGFEGSDVNLVESARLN